MIKFKNMLFNSKLGLGTWVLVLGVFLLLGAEKSYAGIGVSIDPITSSNTCNDNVTNLQITATVNLATFCTSWPGDYSVSWVASSGTITATSEVQDGDQYAYAWVNITTTTTFTLTVTPTNTACISTPATATCTITVLSPLTTADPAGYWNGQLNIYWSSYCNWEEGVIPTSATDVVIASTATNNCQTNGYPAVCHNMTIQNGKTLSMSAGTLSIYGNWTNDGTFSCSGSGPQVHFVGSSPQTIGGANVTTFGSMVINNTTEPLADATITLNKPITIGCCFGIHNLTFTRGFIVSSSANILNFYKYATCSFPTPKNNSFVDGPVSKENGTAAFAFPLGSISAARSGRIEIGVPTGTVSTTFKAQYFAASYSVTNSFSAVAPVLNNVSTIEYWHLDRTAGTGNATVKLYWEDAALSGINDCSNVWDPVEEVFVSDLKVAHWDAANGWWEVNNSSVAITGSCTVSSPSGTIRTSQAASEFSPFTFGSLSPGVNPLPVELLSFNAECNDGKVDVNWTTASERNNDYFEIQRKDGRMEGWKDVGHVKGAGNSSTIRNYEFTDLLSFSEGGSLQSLIPPSGGVGALYYRLRQVDFNGQSETFSPLAVSCSEKSECTVTSNPNPVNGNEIYLTMKGIKTENATVTITDVLGNIMYSKNVMPGKNHAFLMPVEQSFTPGLYIVNLAENDKQCKTKLVVK